MKRKPPKKRAAKLPRLAALLAAKREAHRLVAEKLRHETFYRASRLVYRVILGIIEDHNRKGPPCPQECDARSKNEGSKPS